MISSSRPVQHGRVWRRARTLGHWSSPSSMRERVDGGGAQPWATHAVPRSREPAGGPWVLEVVLSATLVTPTRSIFTCTAPGRAHSGSSDVAGDRRRPVEPTVQVGRDRAIWCSAPFLPNPCCPKFPILTILMWSQWKCIVRFIINEIFLINNVLVHMRKA